MKPGPETFRRYAVDPMAFIEDCPIPVGRKAQRFGDVMAPEQRAFLTALARKLAGRGAW